MTRLRARLAVLLLRWAERLCGVKPSDGDYDTCVHCGATGCEAGTAEHRPDCPSETGVFPVTLSDVWPHGPSCCDRCGAVLWPGDSYAHIPQGDIGGIPVFEVSCVGCSVLVQLENG